MKIRLEITTDDGTAINPVIANMLARAMLTGLTACVKWIAKADNAMASPKGHGATDGHVFVVETIHVDYINY